MAFVRNYIANPKRNGTSPAPVQTGTPRPPVEPPSTTAGTNGSTSDGQGKSEEKTFSGPGKAPKPKPHPSLISLNSYYCPICLYNSKVIHNCTLLATECGHIFCSDCIFFHCHDKARCPICKRDISPPNFTKIHI